jgi:hypothetical protein
MATATVPVHAHRCMACADKGKNVIWIHADTDAGNVALHKCPQCGEVQWKKFLVEPRQLQQAQQSQAQVNFETILGYVLVAVALALLGYCAYIYVKGRRGSGSELPH